MRGVCFIRKGSASPECTCDSDISVYILHESDDESKFLCNVHVWYYILTKPINPDLCNVAFLSKLSDGSVAVSSKAGMTITRRCPRWRNNPASILWVVWGEIVLGHTHTHTHTHIQTYSVYTYIQYMCVWVCVCVCVCVWQFAIMSMSRPLYLWRLGWKEIGVHVQ